MNNRDKPPLLVLLGPTAAGKTRISLDIAKRWHSEIISGDSMQVYQGMDIGTAKITEIEMQGIRHHLIDILSPRESFSVNDFQHLAGAKIKEIAQRGNLPFLVGGTGLYIESLIYGFQFTEVAADPAFREMQVKFAETCGAEALHDKLKACDPETAERLHANDRRRIIRALEVYHLTGIPLSKHLAGQNRESPYDPCIIGLTMDRALLYRRIEARVDDMLESGLIREVQELLNRGYTRDLTAMQAIGYKEIIGYLDGEYDIEEAVRLLKRNTRQFAKRQLSWFRHMRNIHWVDLSNQENFSAHLDAIHDIISAKFAKRF